MQNGMAEATRLTQQGRLEEATAAIQRSLGWTSFPVGGSKGTGDGPIDITSRVVKRASQGPADGRFGALRRPNTAARSTPQPNPLTRGMAGMVGTKARSASPASVPDGAHFIEGSYGNGSGTRSYKLYVPGGYSGQAVPLVVMLHGCTQDPDDFATGTRMNELAEEHTFLVAYPAQAGNANMQKCWNWFQVADQQRGRGEPSIIAGITKQIVDEYEVAEDQVYVAGMSAGERWPRSLGRPIPTSAYTQASPPALHTTCPRPSRPCVRAGQSPQRRTAQVGAIGRSYPPSSSTAMVTGPSILATVSGYWASWIPEPGTARHRA